MKPNYYMLNLQKLLFMVNILHQRGYERLRVIPSLAPTGLAWRCSFIPNEQQKDERVYASIWLGDKFKLNDKEIELSTVELADLFEEEYADFLIKATGENKLYVDWYKAMLDDLQPGELPYAFSDYRPRTNYWCGSRGRKFPTLPKEESYYYE